MLDWAERLPGSAVDVDIVVDDTVRMKGTARYAEDNVLDLIGDPRRYDPAELKRWEQLDPATPKTFQISTRGRRGRSWRNRRWEASLLRSAYLWAFSVFGYGFLINYAMPAIRGQIKHPEETVLPVWGVFQKDDLPDELLGISVICKPDALRSFLVTFDLYTTLKRRRYCVLLPGPTWPGTDIYEQIRAGAMADPGVTFTITRIPTDLAFLSDPALAFTSHQIWKEAATP
jgi:hypothetical protein